MQLPFFLLMITTTISLSQETTKLTKNHEDPNYKEMYYVLTSDKITKHGNYQKRNSKNDVLINGYFNNGLKDSVWTEYYWNGKPKLSQGHYSKDVRIGIWEFYNFNKEIIQKYDFDAHEILFFKKEVEERKYKVIYQNDTLNTLLERPPLCIGGSATLFQTVTNNIQYPQPAKENGTSGKVLITFIVDEGGKTSNYRIITSVGYGCDEEALRIVKLIPNPWIPALLDGKPVKVEYVQSVNFQLQ